MLSTPTLSLIYILLTFFVLRNNCTYLFEHEEKSCIRALIPLAEQEVHVAAQFIKKKSNKSIEICKQHMQPQR